MALFEELLKNKNMLRVFIDESGDLGSGGRFFVMAAVVFLGDFAAKKGSRLVRKARKNMRVEELKSSRMHFEERQAILNRLMNIDGVDFFYFIAEKSQVSLLRGDYSKNLIYNYFAKLLVDEIFKTYSDKMYILFDERTTKVQSMNSLKDYLLIDACVNFGKKNNEIIIEQADSRAVNNLQLADLISGTVYQAYSRKKRHFLDIIGRKVRSANEFPEASFSQKMFRESDGSLLGSLRKLTGENERRSFDSAPALL